MIFIYTTIGTKKAAVALSHKLVKAKLAACVGNWPIEAIYHWKGKMRQVKEYALLVKTSKRQCKQAMEFIRKNHSYELPPVVTIPITASFPEYKKWVVKGTT